MHPWTRTLHRNAMEAARLEAKRPKRTMPLAARSARKLGWFTDDSLAKLKAELLAQAGGPGPHARDLIGQIEFELSERKLDQRRTS